MIINVDDRTALGNVGVMHIDTITDTGASPSRPHSSTDDAATTPDTAAEAIAGTSPVRAPGEIPPGLVPVTGNPGWESLPEEERERALTPMSVAAREWLTRHRADVLAVARAFEVSPIALGGIVAAEETLVNVPICSNQPPRNAIP